MPLWSARVIAALPEQHPLGDRGPIHWQDLSRERFLLPQHGPGPELERLLANKLHRVGPERILRQDAGLDRHLSLVSAGYGVLRPQKCCGGSGQDRLGIWGR
ncbi:MAG: hypothetical protein J0I21_08045 [Alphaproteobacteria bacterium]|nr:hypothetical protein [Alphaproteobacteria bacterium]